MKYLLNRKFTADKSGDKWLTNVTGFKCTDGKLYLSPIPDVYNREIVAYSLGRRANGKMVMNMLDKAFCRLKEQRFFGTLKAETFYQEGALSVAELTGVIDDYIRY